MSFRLGTIHICTTSLVDNCGHFTNYQPFVRVIKLGPSTITTTYLLYGITLHFVNFLFLLSMLHLVNFGIAGETFATQLTLHQVLGNLAKK